MATAGASRSATVGKHISASSPSLKVSRPFAVFNNDVNMSELTGEPGEGWSKINCVSKKAYGCGDLGKMLVESLRLYVWFGDYPVLTSSLAIRISDEAVGRIEAEFGVLRNGERRPCDRVSGVARLEVADGRLIDILLAFHNQRSDRLDYHLVYDAIDSSLTLINYLPDGLQPSGAQTPLLNRIGDCGGDFQLVLLAAKYPSCNTSKDLLCMCTPDSRANPSANDMGPWKVMGCRIPKQVPEPFIAELAFTFQGKAFWVDFMLGCLMYCDLLTCTSHVEFTAIDLPHKCLVNLENAEEYNEQMKMIRTMGCVGDSIWLVCIHRSKTSADDLLTMWTLDLAKKRWKQEVEISTKSLWELDCFKKAGLPKTALKYPFLTANGALCLVLPEQRYSAFGPIQDRICCFDVHGWNLLWHGYAHDYDANSPVILPSNFFKRATSRARADTGMF